MSILDIFRTTDQPAATMPQPTAQPLPQVPQAPAQQMQQLPEAKVLGATTQPPADEFADLWVVDPNAEAANAPFSFNLDPAQLSETAKKLSVAPNIPVELQQRIAAGGQDAITAMMEMQDLTAQTVFAKNAAATTALIEQAMQSAQARMMDVIDQRVKTLGVRNNALELNGALNDPSVRPLVHTIQQRILQKFPDATQAEIAQKTNDYFSRVGGILNPQPARKAQQAATTRAAADINWADELFS